MGDGNTVIENDIALNTLQSNKANEGNFNLKLFLYLHTYYNKCNN